MPHTVLLLALEPSLPAQMVQVGDALAHGMSVRKKLSTVSRTFIN